MKKHIAIIAVAFLASSTAATATAEPPGAGSRPAVVPVHGRGVDLALGNPAPSFSLGSAWGHLAPVRLEAQTVVDDARSLRQPCPVEPPAGARVESEVCGGSSNGGCSQARPGFELIEPGEIVYGTVWGVAGTVIDTDWYQVIVSESVELTWTVQAEFDSASVGLLTGFIDTQTLGSGDCADTTGDLYPYAMLQNGLCSQAVVRQCVPPGVYWLYVSPMQVVDLPCGAGNRYVASLVAQPCCTGEAPANARLEDEPCGADTNGGCNMATPAFEPIAIGESVLGTVWATTEVRETDGYQVVVAQTTPLIWTVSAEFGSPRAGLLIGFLESNVPGSGDCAQSTGYLNPYAYAFGDDCAAVSVQQCVYPGVYWMFVGTADWSDLPCDGRNRYLATLTSVACEIPQGACCYEDGRCVQLAEAECLQLQGGWYWTAGATCEANPCRQPQPGDDCTLPAVVTLPAQLPYVDAGQTTSQRGNDCDHTCLHKEPWEGNDYDGGEDMVYQLVVTSRVRVDIGIYPHGTTSTALLLSTSCSPATDCLATSWTPEANPHIQNIVLEPGTYYVVVDKNASSGSVIPVFDLRITPRPEPGACCVDDTCMVVFESQCLGVWAGPGTQCSGEDCNQNGRDDLCDILSGDSSDCQNDGVPDECQIASAYGGLCAVQCDTDANGNGVPDGCEHIRCAGDGNCDGSVNWRDIDYLIAGLNDARANWAALFPNGPTCLYENLDCNADGQVNWRDIDPFIVRFNQTCE